MAASENARASLFAEDLLGQGVTDLSLTDMRPIWSTSPTADWLSSASSRCTSRYGCHEPRPPGLARAGRETQNYGLLFGLAKRRDPPLLMILLSAQSLFLL